jgi:hypothetical protein
MVKAIAALTLPTPQRRNGTLAASNTPEDSARTAITASLPGKRLWWEWAENID